MRKSKCKVSVVFVLTLFLIFERMIGTPVCLAAKEAEEKVGTLYARAAVLMDAETGRVLLGKNEKTAMPMASTTKILTCILALENGWQDDIVLVSENAESQPKVHAGIREGEQYWLTDLLYSLMLESHNDSAVAIAEHIGGSVEEFAEIMNEKAKEIGCMTAHFVTPNGLDMSDENGVHSISAEDLAKIMSYCIRRSPKAKEFLEITQTTNYSFSEITGKRSISCTNHNSLLTMRNDIISGKTGFTGDAGYCYIGAAESEGRTFVVALLAAGWPNNKNYKWEDCKKLFDYGKENYFYEDIWEELPIECIRIENGISAKGIFEESYSQIHVDSDEKRLQIMKSDEEAVDVKVHLEENIQAPVPKNQIIGEITYYVDGEVYAIYPVVTNNTVKEKTFLSIMKEIVELYLDIAI